MLPVEMKKDEGGYILTDTRMETSIKGIFACGDVRAQLVRQITNAVGDGTTAAVAAEKYIEELEAGRAGVLACESTCAGISSSLFLREKNGN